MKEEQLIWKYINITLEKEMLLPSWKWRCSFESYYKLFRAIFIFAPYINNIKTLFTVPTDAHCYTNTIYCSSWCTLLYKHYLLFQLMHIAIQTLFTVPTDAHCYTNTIYCSNWCTLLYKHYLLFQLMHTAIQIIEF